MTRSKKPKRTRSYFAGEKRSNRVRLHAHPRDGTLFLEYRDEAGKRHNLSLRHREIERGKQAADELAAELRKSGGTRKRELTLQVLFDRYERERTPTKSALKQKHDKAARALFESCWGPTTRVEDLDRRDWDRFIEERRSGRLRPAGRKSQDGVRDRMIAYDLKFVMAVFHWAEGVREDGSPLLARSPFYRFALPAEISPRRPRITESEYGALQAAARELGQEVELFLFLSHETGHRSDSVANLRWSDIDLTRATIFWRKDKVRHQHFTPLDPSHVAALRAARAERGHIGDAWVFPSGRDAAQPVGRNTLRNWWDRLAASAKLADVKGLGWHALRRKFADDHGEEPLAVVMALGGWKSSKTVVEVYQRPNEEKLRAALARRRGATIERAKRDATTICDNQGTSIQAATVPEVAASA